MKSNHTVAVLPLESTVRYERQFTLICVLLPLKKKLHNPNSAESTVQDESFDSETGEYFDEEEEGDAARRQRKHDKFLPCCFGFAGAITRSGSCPVMSVGTGS
jgi:hypothetical protein